jgi:hypothetical protein
MSEQVIQNVDLGDSVIFQTLHDEIVLLNLTEHEYYGLDSVGAEIWSLLLKHRNLDATIKAVQEIYAVDEETARRDVEALVKELLASGLLKTQASDT